MKFLKEWVDEKIIIGEDIDFSDFNEFSNLENIDKIIHGTHEPLKKANWESRKIIIVLKNLNNSKISESEFIEFVAKLKVLRKIDHSNINHFLGLTRDSYGNYFSVLQYANKGNLRDYLKTKQYTLRWGDKLQIALDITRGLMYLHSEKIVHGNLHAFNVLVNNGTVMIADLKILKQAAEVASEKIVYVEPQYLRNPSYERDMKSDIYSLGVLLWELSSGRPPFFDYTQKEFDLDHIKNKLLNGEREEPVANTPSEYLQLYQQCWKVGPSMRPEINEVYEILYQLKLQSDINGARVIDGSRTAKITLEIFNTSPQQIIRQFKLNHGLVLNGTDIKSSIQRVTAEDGELKINLYKGQPLVYTCINSEDNDLELDTCINFPVAEIIYNGNLLESFLEYTNDEKILYGDYLARKFIAGGKLFIKNFNLAAPTQIDILKYYLLCVYYSAKYSTEIQFSNLVTLNLLPELVALDGERLDTHENLVNWMNNLYQKKKVDIISYDNLVSISQLRLHKSLVDSDPEILKEKQPGVVNFKEKLSLKKWVEDAVNDNLIIWTRNINLFQGLIINKNDEIEISKKVPINITEIPEVNSINKFYLELIKPSTKLEFTLFSNHIFSIENLSTFPFIKNDDQSYKGCNHVLVKCEKREILLNAGSIKPTEEFEQAIEEALNNMKPLKTLQDVFNEYGHLFPQRFVLGRCLKNILQDFSSPNTFGEVNDDNKILESLDNLNISYLLTQKGRVVEKNNLHNWIQTTDNNLEIVKFDNIIPLYKILGVEQQRKIDDILKDNYRIVMTGITDLKDLNINNEDHYKRIDFESPFESENYQVFGSIFTKDKSKSKGLEEIYVNFGLYDFNGFYAIIKKVEETSIDITGCYISWVVIGKPSQLSVFSPNNRELQVDYIKKSIKLQPDMLNYSFDSSFTLHEGYIVFVHANHSSISYEPNNIIKLVEWKDKSISFQIKSARRVQSGSSSSPDNYSDHEDNDEIDMRVFILSTNYKSLKIDNAEESECSLDLIGHILNEENFNGSLFNESNKNVVSVNVRHNDSIVSQSLNIQLEPNDKGILSSFFFMLSHNLINSFCYILHDFSG
ncbi:Cdc15p [Rhizophagus irregularis DAOM 197198w]|uniref:Cdc15p n=1 Tax=Rhizophagus irregularis (strain DAOM 197198w) TaxID=1432141 RepID=A0A015LAJ2_RHIIW|nr:Cdc15p [Rhizophagus irregularis DAOM 197198w]